MKELDQETIDAVIENMMANNTDEDQLVLEVLQAAFGRIQNGREDRGGEEFKFLPRNVIRECVEEHLDAIAYNVFQIIKLQFLDSRYKELEQHLHESAKEE